MTETGHTKKIQLIYFYGVLKLSCKDLFFSSSDDQINGSLVWEFEFRSLEFVCYLLFGICDFVSVRGTLEIPPICVFHHPTSVHSMMMSPIMMIVINVEKIHALRSPLNSCRL